MNVFEAVKQSVTTRQAASFYGIRVGRNGMVCCPFHNDRTPSMKVDSRFYCFGCGASGDVIDFAALLHGLGKREAAVRLAEDFGVSYEKSGNAPPDRKRHNRSQPRQKSAEQRFQETERYCFRVLCDYLRLLEHWKTAHAPQPQDAIWHPLFVEALQRISYTEYLLDILLYGEIEEKSGIDRRTKVEEKNSRVRGKRRTRSRKKTEGRRKGEKGRVRRILPNYLMVFGGRRCCAGRRGAGAFRNLDRDIVKPLRLGAHQYHADRHGHELPAFVSGRKLRAYQREKGAERHQDCCQ